MRNDKARIYGLEFALIFLLFLALFVPNILKNRLAIAVFLGLYAVIVKYVIRKKSKYSIYQKKELLLLILLAFIYLIIFYMFGMYVGYKPATVKFSFINIFKYILPVAVIIVFTEFIRSRFLTGKTKLSLALTFLFGVLIDLIVYANINQLESLNSFLLVLGYVFFASCSANLLYNYISNRFGMKSVIIYKLITTLYVYIIPVVPDLYIFFKTFMRMLYPYIIYVIFENMFAKVRKENAILYDSKSSIFSGVLVVLMIFVVMLVSCNFLYGILVVGSGSMTGALNKGDAIIFKQYKDDDKIVVGDVIIFKKEDVKIVHRLVDIKNVNGEYRFYTKGDRNSEMDEGYLVKDDIMGVAKLRIKYLGLPTLYLREMFDKE